MAFNPLVFARLGSRYIERKNPVKAFVNSVLYMVLTFVNLPYKMKLLDQRLKDYHKRLNELENAINEGSQKSRDSGNKFNVLR